MGQLPSSSCPSRSRAAVPSLGLNLARLLSSPPQAAAQAAGPFSREVHSASLSLRYSVFFKLQSAEPSLCRLPSPSKFGRLVVPFPKLIEGICCPYPPLSFPSRIGVNPVVYRVDSKWSLSSILPANPNPSAADSPRIRADLLLLWL